MSADLYRAFADVVLVTHVAFVVFVILGLILIVCGGCMGWGWVRNPWFRVAHLTAIGLVVMQSWFGIVCPLTTLERFLRDAAGEASYEKTFVAHWLHRVLFFEAPMWVFTICYTLFGLAVVVSWIKFRPRAFRLKN